MKNLKKIFITGIAAFAVLTSAFAATGTADK